MSHFIFETDRKLVYDIIIGSIIDYRKLALLLTTV